MSKPVYFDYAAATPSDKRVVEVMINCMSIDGAFANPHAKDHVYGWQAAEAVENAREQVANLIGASPLEITFTSGATESNNLAIFGLARGLAKKGDKRRHIITSKIEHKAILEACQLLEDEGYRVTYLSPDKSGVIDTDSVCMIAGTWSINEYLRSQPVLDGKVQMNSLFCLPQYYLIEESSPTSAGNFEWFIQQLLPELAENAKRARSSIYDIIDQWVEAIDVKTFVPVFLPFLMASNVHPNAKGCLIGLSYNHTRKHIARAIFEGITFCHRYHYEKLLATRESRPDRIRLAGGAARAEVWAQMFADVMNTPVETVEAHETGALGCAIAAAVATGEYESISEAVMNMTRISDPIMPDPERVRIYEKKYQLYVKIIESLDGLWDDMQELAEEKYDG